MKRQSVFILLTILLIFFIQAGCKKNTSPKTFTIPSLCTTPPLGWNSFDSYLIYLNYENASKIIDVMAEKYLPFGYEYFVIDAGWYFEEELVPGTNFPSKRLGLALDEFGVYEPCTTYFAKGIKPLADKAHSLGLKFGLHLMRGIPRQAVEMNLPIKGTKYFARDIADTSDICSWSDQCYGVDMSKPGAQEWYNSIFEKFAAWGLDFVKVDDMTPFPLEILAVEKAILNSGRPMVYSLSPGNVFDSRHLPYYQKSNMLRITPDIWDRKADLDKPFEALKAVRGTAGQGFWPDLDMIPFGQLVIEIPEGLGQKPETKNIQFSHWCRLTKDQMMTFITIRALAASPLMIGGDLLTMDDFSYSLLTNKKMLECNQNGVMGVNIFDLDSLEIWHVCDAGQFGEGWIGVFNRSSNLKEKTFTRTELGLVEFVKTRTSGEMEGDFKIFDVWNNKYLTLADSLNLAIPPDGVIFLEYTR